MKLFKALSLIVPLVLAGCGGAATATATPRPTSTPKPTFTTGPSPTPRPTYTPLPTRTPMPDPTALVAGLDELCERAFIAEVGEGGELGAPLILMRKKDYLEAGQEGAGWQPYPLAHLDARYRSDAQLVLCASESREQDRTYSDGTPGYQRTWTVRIVKLPDEDVLGEMTLQGAGTSMFVWAAKDAKAIYADDPHFQLLDFLYGKLGTDDVALIGDSVEKLQFAGTGGLLAVVNDVQNLILWDTVSAKQVSSTDANFEDVYGLAGSPVAEEVAVGMSDGELVVWNLEDDSRTTLRPAGEGDILYELVYSPDGRYLAGVDEEADELLVWDVAAGKLLHTLSVPGVYRGVRFSPQVGYVMVQAQDGLRIYDLSSGEQSPAFEGGAVTFTNGASYAADGSSLSDCSYGCLAGSAHAWVDYQLVGGEYDLMLVDTDGAEFALKGHPDKVTTAAFSPDGELLATGDEGGMIILWDVAARKIVDQLYGHTGEITHLVFSPDGGMLASGSEDGTVRFWGIK